MFKNLSLFGVYYQKYSPVMVPIKALFSALISHKLPCQPFESTKKLNESFDK